MKLFDLHCDTLYEMYEKNQRLYKNNLQVSLDKAKSIDKYIGCFAVWIPDNYREDRAVNFFDSVYKNFQNEIVKNSKHISQLYSGEDINELSSEKMGVILAVEGGSVLGGDIDKIKYLYNCGVRVMTLTWNGENEIGGGSSKPESGITQIGTQIIKELEKIGIIIDVSHAGRKLFYDVCEISQKPFIATHSNSYSVCKHERNLTDDQINIIKENEGIIGITFCTRFLNSEKDASLHDIIKHIDHFLSMGAEKILAVGSDFDGADMPSEIKGIQDIGILYEYLLRKNYNESLVNDIFYNNAYNFFRRII